jgi:hypothetical protein
MKKPDAMLSEGEGLRRAVAWLADRPRRDASNVEEASRRFNLSPLDEQFLLDHFRVIEQDRPRLKRNTLSGE